MARLDDPLPAELAKQLARADAEEHHDQRGGNGRVLEQLRLSPDREERDGEQADRRGPGMQIGDEFDEFRERVLLVGLLERHFSFRVGVVSEDVGDLLQN